MKEANTWVITEALRSCDIMDDNALGSLILIHMFLENGFSNRLIGTI